MHDQRPTAGSNGDAIGLLAIRPRCEGDCVIRLTYDGGTEMLVAESLLVDAGLLLAGVLLANGSGERSRDHRQRSSRQTRTRPLKVESQRCVMARA